MKTHRILSINFDLSRLDIELRSARQFRYSDAYSEFICGLWRSCMLWNHSGEIDDNVLNDYDHPAKITAYGHQMPYLAAILTSTFDLSRLRFARLATLTPGSVLIPHRDYLELKNDLTRIHIPLATDSRCFSAEQDTVYQMRLGEAWFIDATRVHTAANFSTKPRTHLILDFTESRKTESLLRHPVCVTEVIPQESIISRKVLAPSDSNMLLALARIIDVTNFKEIFAVVIKKYFTTDVDVITAARWMLEIAQLSGDSDVIAQVKRIHDHCLIERQT